MQLRAKPAEPSIRTNASYYGRKFSTRKSRVRWRIMRMWLVVVLSFCVSTAKGQDPVPETAPTMAPGAGLLSFESVTSTRGLRSNPSEIIPLTARPTFSRAGLFTFKWGFYPNFDFTVILPVITNQFQMPSPNGNLMNSGTGLGDALLLVKYRCYRQDSERGTTQVSLTFGPKIPTGRTDLTDMNGKPLPATLQPGTGSTDFLFAANGDYTGLFHLKRLAADGDLSFLLHSTGTQSTRLGSEFQSRLWLSYRPYQSKDGTREWFIGPTLSWMRQQDDSIAEFTQLGSGGRSLLAGVKSFVGLPYGLLISFGMDWNVAHWSNPQAGASGGGHAISESDLALAAAVTPPIEHYPIRRSISAGITWQKQWSGKFLGKKGKQ